MNAKRTPFNWKGIVLPLIMLAITVGILYMMHVQGIFSQDDIYYSSNLATNEPLHNVNDIIEGQVWHYFNWGGRTVAHTLLQVTLLCGDTFANITNLVCTAILVLLICLIGKRSGLWSALCVISLLFLMNPNWYQTLIWQSGFANYVYTSIIILLFLYYYLKLGDEPKWIAHKATALWVVPLGLLSGWSNENMGPTVWLVTLCIIIYLRKTKKKIPLWSILGNISCFIGSMLVVLAPGNFLRVEDNYGDVTYGLKMKIFLRFYHIGVSVYHYIFPLLLLTAVVLIVYRFIAKEKFTLTTISLLAAAVISIGAMVLSPHYPSRSTFGTLVLLVTAIVSMVSQLLKSHVSLALPCKIMTFILWCGMIFLLVEHYMNTLQLIPYA